MATTFLESPRFPDNIAFGATVGPTYLTAVNQVYSGRDSRIVAWTQARIKFEVGRRCMNAADTATLDAFFRTVKGRAYGFRIKDWTDYADGNVGVLTAQSALGVYQLGKLYSNGALSETRLIQKPVAGTVVVTRNGSAYGGSYSLDTTTGLVTLQPIASQSVTAVTVGTTTQVTLAAAIPGLAVNGTLYLTGLGGANAGTLNGKQFTITAISGAVYTLNVNTAGQTITASGSGQMYPQPSDVLAWTGQFDVPARFDTDECKKQIMDRNGPNGDLLVDWGSIPIIEVRP
ncbi:Uncharacterized conserved protein [Burkholderia pseudomallei]|uniref:DUF2460 domain-containing protein n=1 Tax=Burkholderia pseudomallei TaxID=28450 RepID=UPI00097596AC|nr:DUF2460 domain-containing protein [Burkholderia pseudomallei]CAJ3065643.1 Uncharacterized conserved protein [Burkholderia pseudomallei]CAJ3073327.1 Uncharacterized conserved protein [Burkholderia pseudomallei]CAJ3703218.1 Uncharacterized conserved protein [Burkholderia pseudomallei]CAJ3729491.1 Uncharacterized conserved protein [Burkholderia pseudomallei]CAJ4725090.1 Uncharacterized conserved protein [Burkholderia pseudomallei]